MATTSTNMSTSSIYHENNKSNSKSMLLTEQNMKPKSTVRYTNTLIVEKWMINCC